MSTLEECKHIYFEPKYLSDALLKYSDTYYHAHRAVLAGHSKYFYNLFESLPATEAANPIELPLLTSTIFAKAEITTDTMTKFLQFFYVADQTTLLCKDGCVLYMIDYLAFYFQCERLESQIQQCTITWIQSNQSTVGLNFFLNSLYETDQFHWTKLRDSVIAVFGSTKLSSFADQKDVYGVYDKISPETKSLVLARALGL